MADGSTREIVDLAPLFCRLALNISGGRAVGLTMLSDYWLCGREGSSFQIEGYTPLDF